MKAWYTSKTIIFNGLVGTFGILEAADLSVIPDEYEGYVILAIAIVGFWLRLITSSAIGAEKPGNGYADPEAGQ